jgi:hypothetical protein
MVDSQDDWIAEKTQQARLESRWQIRQISHFSPARKQLNAMLLLSNAADANSSPISEGKPIRWNCPWISGT